MKIPSFWIRETREIAGRPYKLRAFSFRSIEEARLRLEEKARALQAFHSSSGSPAAVEALRCRLRAADAVGEGDYEVVIAEPILQRIDAHNIVTRNRYGAEVLNSDDTCFLDVDHFRPGLMACLLGIFGIRRSAEESLLRTLRCLSAEDATLSARVYRTARGWRLLVRAAQLAPDSPRMLELCRRLQVDEMYTALCCKQRCWRARLSPKPARLGMPPFPLAQDSEHASAAAEEWVALYSAKQDGFAVCRLVESIGPPISSPIVTLHDSATAALRPDRTLR